MLAWSLLLNAVCAWAQGPAEAAVQPDGWGRAALADLDAAPAEAEDEEPAAAEAKEEGKVKALVQKQKEKAKAFVDQYTNAAAWTKHATRAVSDLTSGVNQQIVEKAQEQNQEAATKLVGLLGGQLKKSVKKLMDEHGVAEYLSEDDTLRVLGALIAATAFVLQDETLPTLRHTHSFTPAGGDSTHRVSAGVSVGSVLNLALQGVEVEYGFTKGAFTTHVGVKQGLQINPSTEVETGFGYKLNDRVKLTAGVGAITSGGSGVPSSTASLGLAGQAASLQGLTWHAKATLQHNGAKGVPGVNVGLTYRPKKVVRRHR